MTPLPDALEVAGVLVALAVAVGSWVRAIGRANDEAIETWLRAANPRSRATRAAIPDDEREAA